MPSVVGLLEQHELAARRRVDGLREEADRIQAELAVAERGMAGVGDRPQAGRCGAGSGRMQPTWPRPGRPGGSPGRERGWRHRRPDAAKPKSQVPVWREGLAWSALSVDYQRILQALADRARLGQGPLTCQEMAAAVRHGRGAGAGGGAAVEGETPGRAGLAGRAGAGPVHARAAAWPGQAAGHEHGHRPVDHRLGAGGAAFVVAGQAAGAHQPGEVPLDDPPLGQHHEAAACRRCV